MPAQIEPRSGLNYGWALGEDNWNDGMDSNMLWLGRFGTHLSVKSRTIGTPPGSPAVGDTYIIPAGATGDWAGQTNAVTIWDGTFWQFAAPRRGWVANIEDGAGLNLYNGTDWATQVGGGAVASHVALADPHTQYVLKRNDPNDVSKPVFDFVYDPSIPSFRLQRAPENGFTLSEVLNAETANTTLSADNAVFIKANNRYNGTNDLFVSDGFAYQLVFARSNGDLRARRSITSGVAGGVVAWDTSRVIWSPTGSHILGTVTQSGGVPTGAIFETGSNANGRYWKFASGMMICTHSLSLPSNGTIGWRFPWTFPSVFAAAPNSFSVTPDFIASGVSAIDRNQIGGVAVNYATATTTSSSFVDVYLLSGATLNPALYTMPVSVIAIGRWF